MGIEIKESQDGQFFYRVKAANGEPLVHSETYPTKHNAKRGTEALYRALDVYLTDEAVERAVEAMIYEDGFSAGTPAMKERIRKKFRKAIYAALPELKAETPFNDLGIVVCGHEWRDGWGGHICWKRPHDEGQHRCECDAVSS